MTDENYLISKYLKFYQSLDSGKRKPETEEQLRFVKVCRGKVQPKSEHEIAYINFKKREEESKHINLANKRLKSLKLGFGGYRPKTALEIQEFRNRAIEDEEYIRKKDYERNIAAIQFDNSNEKCKRCGAAMVWRERKSLSPTKYFLGCSRYPRCKYVESGSW